MTRAGKGAFQQIAAADAVRAVAREHGFRAATAGDACGPRSPPAPRAAPVLDELARRLALGVAQPVRRTRPAAGGAGRRDRPGRRQRAGRAGAARGRRDHPGDARGWW